jgi:hypothetical protein
MAYYGIFRECPLSSIRPQGWLKQSLERYRDGLTGNLEAAGYPFDSISWHGDESKNPCSFVWEPYEQTGYWVDGMLRCAILLDDANLRAKAELSIGHVLDHQRENGYLGPESMRVLTRERLEDTSTLSEYKRRWRWPHAVFFRAFMALNSNERTATALNRHYMGDRDYEYGRGRDVLNLESAHWAAEVSQNDDLHQLASQWYSEFNERYPKNPSTLAFMLSEQRDIQHGVTFNEMAKLGAIEYLYSGDVTKLRATENAYRKLDRDQMLVDGICSSTEHLRGKDPLDGHETCDIADFLWSVGYLLMATGNARYADKMERALFNAGYGAVTPDAKALQYFSGPNQVICDSQSNHNSTFQGCRHMSYRPNPGTPCCPGDVNRIVPGFASRMWLEGENGSLTAALYAPGRFSGNVGPQKMPVSIAQTCNYPFEENVRFEFSMDEPVDFIFNVRIPGWCANPILTVNGERVEHPLWGGSFVPIQRTFADGDVVELDLPMEFAVSHWPKGGIAIERGPLVYSLKITEEWHKDLSDENCTADMPAWNIYPKSAWNYGLALDETSLSSQLKLIKKETGDAYPWSAENSPLELELDAWPLKGWDLNRQRKVAREIGDGDGNENIPTQDDGCFTFTPQLPPVSQRGDMLGAPVKVQLLPYGCTQLRITIFPELSSCITYPQI